MNSTVKTNRVKLFLITCIAGVVIIALTLWGRYPKPGLLTLNDILHDELALRMFILIRVPRMVAALLLGAVLGLSGCVFQYVFANPLVDSGFLGVSQGAGLGSIIAMLAGFPFTLQIGCAFAGALLSLALSILLAKYIRFGGLILRLVLAGIAVSSVLSALISLIKFTADPLRQLPEITYWLMGGLSGVCLPMLVLPSIIAGISCLVLISLRWQIGLLALDDRAVRSLIKNPFVLRIVLLAFAVAGTAAVTAYAGIVAWAGLIVPHIARIVFGAETRSTVPASIVLGSMFMAVCDTLARSLFPIELPLGIVTALAGAASFTVLLVFIPIKVERG